MLADVCKGNAESLHQALRFCAEHEIGCFRVNSQIMPLRTHPEHGYRADELPGADEIVAAYRRCGEFAQANRIRLSFHPDQFVVLNSPRADVVNASLAEIEYQAEVAEWIGADVINIHAGGVYGDKNSALTKFARSLDRLSNRARIRLTVENDDRSFTPSDLLPLCRAESIPFVYDIHHHRCTFDPLPEGEATRLALDTWDREPLFHISSPRGGWCGTWIRHHDDFIDLDDFPNSWRSLDVTVEVEAKAKELAVLDLKQKLEGMRACVLS
jgi:UV DNA damage endonuclease